MSHSTRLSGSHTIPRDLSLLITARDSYFGSCTCLFFRDTFRDLRIACNSRSTPFLNIHWYQKSFHSWPCLASDGYSIQDARQNRTNRKPAAICQWSDLDEYFRGRASRLRLDHSTFAPSLNLRLYRSSHLRDACQSWQFYQTLFEVRDGLSMATITGYLCGNAVLNGLNVFW